MFCSECGKLISNECIYCPECGAQLVRLSETNNTAENRAAQKENDKLNTNSSSPYRGLMACAIVILISSLILPIYYYEGGNLKLSIFFLGNSSISQHFGRAFNQPLIKCNTIVFVCLALTSVINMTLARKKKNNGAMFCFFIELCAMIVYPIYVYENLPDLNTVRTVSIGFFVIVITIVIGMMFSYKCNTSIDLRETSTEKSIGCKKCGSVVNSENKFCPHCGGLLLTDGWLCDCGNANASDDNFCANCGKKKKVIHLEPSAWLCSCGAIHEWDEAFCSECGKPCVNPTVPTS